MKRIYRERFDKKIAGVCGGLAQYFHLDSAMIRLIFILASILSLGIAVIIYLVLWMILPLGPIAYVEAKYKRLFRSKHDRKIAGICGGLGAYFKIDSNVIRVIFLALLVFTGFFPITISYLVGIVIIPEQTP